MVPAPPAVLPALTGVRAVAAWLVVLHHFGRAEHWEAPAPLRALGAMGLEAVSLFFVLSGFILAYVNLGPGAPARSVRTLWVSRWARVYPVYLLGWVLAAPGYMGLLVKALGKDAAGPAILKHGVATLFGVQALIPAWALTWNPPGWSVSVELFFYALFPWLGPAFMRLTLRDARRACAVLWVTGVLPVVAYRLSGITEDAVLHPIRNAVLYFPLLRLPEFVLGMLTARQFLECPPAAHHGRTALAALGVVPVVVVSGALLGVDVDPVKQSGLLAPAFALIILHLAHGGGVAARVLSTPFFRVLGESSYALYILHVPVVLWCAFVFKGVAGQSMLEQPAVMVPVLVGVQGVAYLVFRSVESPLRRWVVARWA